MRTWKMGIAAWVMTACLHRPPLPQEATATLYDTPTHTDALIYQGTVHPRTMEKSPLYRYERRVSVTEDNVRSVHTTFSLSGEPVVRHQADHTFTYTLRAFQEIHAQTGLVGRVDVAPDGTATYQTTTGGRTHIRVEAPGESLQVGPTLFGFALEHWDELVAREDVPFRFVVLEKQRSYRFVLRKVDGPEGTLTLEMTPTSWFVALGVPRSYLVFDEDSRTILRYIGLVPPRDTTSRRHKPLDATVIYMHTGTVYR
ncbi:MAG: hypothetical protein AAFV53_31290 [Myxococcota bacterium]